MKKCVLVLDNIRSVANVGSIFRTAESFRVSEVILVGTTPAPVDRFGRKRRDFAKVALGTEEVINWEYEKDVKEAINKLRSEEYEIIALESIANAESLTDFKTKDKFALIVGNEVGGVSVEALDMADKVVEIPMAGTKESLNVAVATGVALYHLLLK